MEEQFTVQHIDGHSTMNRAAYEEYQQALEARRSMGRYSLEEAAQYVADNSNASAKSIFTKLKESAQTGELIVYAPGSNEVYKPKASRHAPGNVVRGWYEEAYWSDLNTWLEKNEPRLVCEFPNPDAQGAKVEARLPVATQQDSAILKWLKENKHDPQKLPIAPKGKAGVKKTCRDSLCENSKQLFSSSSVFDTAWERLRANDKIKDA